MKKKLLVLLFISLVFTLSACGYKGNYSYFNVDIKNDFDVQTGYGIAFPKGSTLVDPVNTVLKMMLDDGTVSSLSNYWTNGQQDTSYENIDFSNKVYNVDYNGNGEKLIILTSSGYFPFEALDENQNLYGLDIDIAKFIAKELNYEIEWQDSDFDKIVGDLAAKKVDLAIAAISITSERSKNVDFSLEYYDESVTVGLHRENDNYNSIDDLKDKVVCAQSGTVQADFIQKLKEEGKVKDVLFVNLPAAGMQSLKNNKIDVLFIEEYVAEKLIAEYNK